MSEIISLAKSMGVKDNTATTKLIADKPNRHSLAIFMPTAKSSATGVNITSSSCTDKVHSDYGGLIEPNTIPPVGNKFSRLLAVVETCHPICGVVSLTKLIGAFPC